MSAYELPIFPLGVVLFPGTPQALHIFEPRYRQLLADCLGGDRRFGLSCVLTDEDDPAPEPGDVGCRAYIQLAAPMADGRSNILTVGEERYTLREWLQRDRLYRVAMVEPYADLSEPDAHALTALATEVRQAFAHYSAAVASLQDVDTTPLELPEESGALSFAVAAAIAAEPRIKQELLVLRTAESRLARLITLLRGAQPDLDARVRVHRRSRRNGKGLRGATLKLE